MTTICNEYNILIPIDVLLETHLGTAAILDPKAPADIIANGYFKRENHDLWTMTDLFTKEQFIDTWRGRNIDTLKCSVIRNITAYLKKMVEAKTIENVDRGSDVEICIYINCYPYQFIDYMKGILCSVINRVFSKIVSVKLVNLTLSELTNQYIVDHRIYAIALNHLDDWLTKHYQSFIAHPRRQLEVYVPMICENLDRKVQTAIDNHEVDIEFLKKMSPYGACELFFSDYLSLNFLPLEFYSIPNIG